MNESKAIAAVRVLKGLGRTRSGREALAAAGVYVRLSPARVRMQLDIERPRTCRRCRRSIPADAYRNRLYCHRQDCSPRQRGSRRIRPVVYVNPRKVWWKDRGPAS